MRKVYEYRLGWVNYEVYFDGVGYEVNSTNRKTFPLFIAVDLAHLRQFIKHQYSDRAEYTINGIQNNSAQAQGDRI